jgi:hypothetical protein
MSDLEHAETLGRIETKLDLVLKVKDDHENRLRSVEKGNWISGSLSTIATGLMAAVLYKMR